MKSCDNCYWQRDCNCSQWCYILTKKPEQNSCDRHEYICEECCDISEAEYDYKGKKYCFDCLLYELGITSYTKTHYMLDEDDIEDALLKYNDDIKLLEE